MNDKPYIEVPINKVERKYNPKYGDNRMCTCGHPYYRHFDTYEQMANVGCKYCGCFEFTESKATTLREILIEQTNRRINKENQINVDELSRLDDRKIVEICLDSLKFHGIES